MTEISKSDLLTLRDSPMKAELAEKELARKLNLYQVFLKLYEHHSSLLDEIIQLESLDPMSLKGMEPIYLQGVVDNGAVYVITNLCDNKTQSLQQPQRIWTIGRDYSSGIQIPDRYLSRRHAAIQYIDNQGFYLIDFKSTNGSAVNGKPVSQQVLLKDGDRIRLGTMTFGFFLNQTSRVLPTVAMELLMQLVPRTGDGSEESQSNLRCLQKPGAENLDAARDFSLDPNLIKKLGNLYSSFSVEQQSEILDRFYSQHKPYNPTS
ncbi:FHA domain-containing protein [Cylindrospermum stagnale PCC 7417]|uniref:FHA domain-containing protein n=1 Tax=Cylindrospermum stagnale PCC 7417 TaxID=56107 RepID=K9WU49_9NOST|nr:FHA domain-containing protein [Cylindrospermum stagnale]AFZ23306.1 FHA domain-containing protein [Cylindrospermum stagnale PCC 7417]